MLVTGYQIKQIVITTNDIIGVDGDREIDIGFIVGIAPITRSC